MLTTIVTGTRPNLIKAAPLIREFEKQNLPYHFIHTGQHYDDNMHTDILKDLDMPMPDYDARVGKDFFDVNRIAYIMTYFKIYADMKKPDLVLVFGDVDSTLAIALASNKLGIPLGHIEAGERSGNKKMPEEMNRILIDEMSDYYFCASEQAYNRIDGSYFVGNLMIDQLKYILEKEKNMKLILPNEPYGLLTLHRQSNVDDGKKLEANLDLIASATEKMIIHFPIHPRTFKHFTEESKRYRNIIFHEPWRYSDFIHCLNNAEFIITDSGGVQNEASYLDIPTITLRDETEWLDTLRFGSNVLCGDIDDPFRLDIGACIKKILDGKWKQSVFHDLPHYNMNASENIVNIIKELKL